MKNFIIICIVYFVCQISNIKASDTNPKNVNSPTVVYVDYFNDRNLVEYASELLLIKKDFDYYVKMVGLNKNIKNYEEKLKNLNFTFGIELISQFKMNPNMFAGYCFNSELLQSSNNEGVIFVNKFTYSGLNHKLRKKLIYHELAHCILGSIHDNRESEQSIMSQSAVFSNNRPDVEIFKGIKSSKNINLINKIMAYNNKMIANPKYIKKYTVNYLYHTEELAYFDKQTFLKDINDYHIKILNNLKKGN